MYDYFQPLILPPESFMGQFILTKNEKRIPLGFETYNKSDWILGVMRLPVLAIENDSGSEIGWCIGHPIDHKNPWAEAIVIDSPNEDCLDMDAFDEFYDNTGGRFIIIFLGKKEERVILDPYGSLSAVYSTSEQTVASTPSYFAESHAWDTEIIDMLKMPEHYTYFPMGLTSRQNVKRLLPNHSLDLKDMSTTRHWPESSKELMVDDNPKQCVTDIISCLQKTINIIGQRYPIQIALTAGEDSRIFLSCIGDLLHKTTFITFAEKKETVDTDISSRLAKIFCLQHKIVPFQEATKKELHEWLQITGHSVSGPVWETHKSFYAFDSDRVLFNGHAVAIGHGFFWRHGDYEGRHVIADDIIKRFKYPKHNRIAKEVEKWLVGLSGFNIFNIMDLAYIEQRLGCWAAPQLYGNQISLFEISPFNQRMLFRLTMKLPYEYRQPIRLTNAIIGQLWPELLEMPFNKWLGLKNYGYKTKKILINTYRACFERLKSVAKEIILILRP